MRTFRFKKIDAFTGNGSAGNPAGCVYPGNISDISDDEMLRIAKELKGFVSETVFLFPEKDIFFLKYFSSECEVNFCGHATIAVMHDIIGSDEKYRNRKTIKIRVRDEILDVFNSLDENGSVFITAPPPSGKPLHASLSEISDALGTQVNQIDMQPGPAVIDAGLRTMIVPLKELNACLKINPDIDKLREFCVRNNSDIILIFSAETSSETNRFRTRVFAPGFGYLEDPATGSGNSAFGYYLLNNSMWDGNLINIEQNNSMEKYNIVKLCSAEMNGTVRVTFGGAATVRISGEYILHD